ncbi:hypothetical protein FRB90_008217, partial [Tulasnella sp. 427]
TLPPVNAILPNPTRTRGAAGDQGSSVAVNPISRRSTRNSRRSRHPPTALSTSVPATPSPLRGEPLSPPSDSEQQQQEQQPLQSQAHGVGMTSGRYISPTDAVYHEPTTDPRLPPPSPSGESDGSVEGSEAASDDDGQSSRRNRENRRSDLPPVSSPPDDDPENPSDGPDSPQPHNSPTPRISDIRLRTLNTHSRSSSVQQTRRQDRLSANNSSSGTHSRSNSTPVNFANLPSAPTPLPAHLRPPSDNPPPAYSPLDAFAYPDGVAIDLPAEMIAAALADPVEQPQQQSQQQGRRSGR